MVFIIIYLIIGIILTFLPFYYLRKLEDMILNDEINPLFAYDLLLLNSLWQDFSMAKRILMIIMLILFYPIIFIGIKLYNKWNQLRS